MKVQLQVHLNDGGTDSASISTLIDELKAFNIHTLKGDQEKKAFWINVYNGLTNYFIIHHHIKETVWEVEGFFKNLSVHIGALTFSLDDIEHGILRKNGVRRNDKPLQFSAGEPKMKLMLNEIDPRIHFALNCGSISCPHIAFYSAGNINQELALAEKSFVDAEFVVNHELKTIDCSPIFDWYRSDFKNTYLGDPALQGYEVQLREYHWTLR